MSSRADAHGTPIVIGVSSNALVAGGGLADTAGFAPIIYVEDDEDGDPFGSVTLPGFGPAIIWQIPGFDIAGLDEHSGLFLDVLSRPFAHVMSVEQRSLWYWNPQSQRVETTPSGNPFQIRKSTSVNVTLSATSGADPPAIQLAEPVAADMGFHNHLVAYALSESTPPPVALMASSPG